MSQDLDLLQGTWTITTLEVDGQALPETLLANARIEIQGDRFVSTGMGAKYAGALVLDAAKRPRRLDMKFDTGPEKGNTNLCIYELDGESLKLCIATRGTVRPPSFASPAGSGFALETLSRGGDRVAPGRGTHPAKRAAVEKHHDGPTTELEGEWQLVSGIMGGKPMDDETVAWVKRVTRGRRTTVSAGPQVMMEFEFTYDETKSPKAIDYSHSAGANKGKQQLGVYELAGGQLTILMSAPGGLRPTRVDAVPGKGGTLTVWRRAK